MAKTTEAIGGIELGTVKIKEDLKAILQDLAHYVNNINIAPLMILNKGVYRQRNKDDVQKTSWQGWEFGYQIVEHKGFLIRKAFLKSPCPWAEVFNNEKDSITMTVMEAMFDKQQALPTLILIAPDCMLIGQRFQVTFLKERNPNLVSISNMPVVGSA